MSTTPLAGVQACVFDAYGTLFDFASAARGCRDVLGDAIEKLTALWRDKQLQYTWLRAVQGRHADFWQVTGDALDFALETLAIEKSGLRGKRVGSAEISAKHPNYIINRGGARAAGGWSRTSRGSAGWTRPAVNTTS